KSGCPIPPSQLALVVLQTVPSRAVTADSIAHCAIPHLHRAFSLTKESASKTVGINYFLPNSHRFYKTPCFWPQFRAYSYQRDWHFTSSSLVLIPYYLILGESRQVA
ncbi:hypothetical protein TIFTF001_050356, partial [Ficus carica]